MTAIYWLLGPQALLTGVCISYFWLLYSSEFRSPQAASDLLILGVIAFVSSIWLFRTRFGKQTVVSERDATTALLCNCTFLAPVVAYLLIASGGLVALVDARFAVPGFGAISSFYFVSAVSGSALCTRSRRPLPVGLFLALISICGFIVGGKGFAGSIVFGFALAARLGWFRFGGFALLAAVGACVAGFAVAVADKTDSALLVLWTRLQLAADAVRWVSALSREEIAGFSVSWWTFLADIPLRFVGVRFNSRSIGSEIAYVVAGDETGGGPNPLLPVIAYLSVGANRLAAVMFLLALLLGIALLMRVLWKKARSTGMVAFYCAVAVALSPGIVIDLIGFLQQAFWIGVLYVVFSVRTTWRRLGQRRRVTRRRRAERRVALHSGTDVPPDGPKGAPALDAA